MKTTLRISILLNLVLLGGMIFLLVNLRQKESAAAPVLSEVKPPAQAAAAPYASDASGQRSRRHFVGAS